MNSLDRITDKVGDKTTIATSTVQLLHNVAAEIRVSAGNETASRSLADMLDSNAQHLAETVMAHTPMILATPPVHPSPSSAGGSADKLDVTSMTGTPEEISDWQGEHHDLREVEREEHPDGSVTVYFRQVHKKSDAAERAAFEAEAKRKAEAAPAA